MQDLTVIFLVVLTLIDFIMILFFLIFYVRFKKVFDLPWEDIKVSVEKAEELVKKLESMQALGKRGSRAQSIKEEVKRLYREGKTIREISKVLGLSEAEVELILSKKK